MGNIRCGNFILIESARKEGSREEGREGSRREEERRGRISGEREQKTPMIIKQGVLLFLLFFSHPSRYRAGSCLPSHIRTYLIFLPCACLGALSPIVPGRSTGRVTIGYTYPAAAQDRANSNVATAAGCWLDCSVSDGLWAWCHCSMRSKPIAHL